ncbi:MAG: hypothetical protein LCH92_01855 [Proteobacteria bacterium]|nr:hypothetical protein [Pseudomonadota bacterium]
MLKLPRKPPAATRPATPARPAPRRRTRVLPVLAALFVIGGGLRLASGVGTALAQDPPGASPTRAEDILPLRSSPVSDARLSLELRERETALAEREAQLDERAALLAAAQERVHAQIDALQAAEAELAATMAQADQAAETDISRLVSVFQTMRPEDAANVFTEMDPDFAAGFLARLEPPVAGAILARIEPRQAYALSAIVAGRNALVPRE